MTPSPGRPIAEDQSTDKLSTMAVFETAVSEAHTKVKECVFSADSGIDVPEVRI